MQLEKVEMEDSKQFRRAADSLKVEAVPLFNYRQFTETTEDLLGKLDSIKNQMQQIAQDTASSQLDLQEEITEIQQLMRDYRRKLKHGKKKPSMKSLLQMIEHY